MEKPQESLPAVSASASTNERALRLSIFMELVDAIPKGSTLRDISGMLRPHYSTAEVWFEAGNLWSDVAHIARAASGALTIYARDNVTSVRADKDVVIAAFKETVLSAVNQEIALRAFAVKASVHFEKMISGDKGFSIYEEIADYDKREKICADYLCTLKPDWFDVDDLNTYGLHIILAMHLADSILKRKAASRPKNTAVKDNEDCDHSARVCATLIVLAEFRTERARVTRVAEPQISSIQQTAENSEEQSPLDIIKEICAQRANDPLRRGLNTETMESDIDQIMACGPLRERIVILTKTWKALPKGLSGPYLLSLLGPTS